MCCSDCVLVKTSTDNSRWQTERCSDDRSSRSLYTSGDLVLQTISPGAKRPHSWLVLFLENMLHYSGTRSNPVDENFFFFSIKVYAKATDTQIAIS